MKKLRGSLLVCSLVLVQCGGKYESAPQAAGGASSDGRGSDVSGDSGGGAAHDAGKGGDGGTGCTAGAGAASGELSAYEQLRSACKLDVGVNRRGAASAGGFTIK